MPISFQSGKSALHMAAPFGQVLTVKMLTDVEGVDVNLQDEVNHRLILFFDSLLIDIDCALGRMVGRPYSLLRL